MKNTKPSIRFAGFTDDWEQRKLGNIVKWSKGNNLAKSVLNETKAGEDVIHYADLYKFNPVVTNVIHWSESGQGTIIPENSLLFPMSDVTPVGLARTSTILKTGVKAGGDTLIGTISIEQIAEFISYQINAIPGKILPLVTGTTVRHISAGALSTLEVMIPTKSEQRKISDFFNNLENLITLHQRQLDLLKEQKKGFLQKMFPKQGAKVPGLRFAGFTDDWVQREFAKMVDRVSESSAAELPRVEFEDLISGMGRLNKDVTKPGDTRSGIHFFAGDVLYGKLRPYLNNWLHATFEGLALGDFWVFRTKEMLESNFLYALIQTPKYQQVANLSSGTKMPRSDWKTVSTTEFGVPEKQEQQKIGALFNNLDNLIAANQRQLDLFKEQKTAFLQKMFI